MKRLRVFPLPLDGMLDSPSQVTPRNLLAFPNNSPVPIYTPGWGEALWELSVLPKNTTQCPWSGLEPGPLNPDERTNYEATAPPLRAVRWSVKVSLTHELQSDPTLWPAIFHWIFPRHFYLGLRLRCTQFSQFSNATVFKIFSSSRSQA